MWKLFQRSLAKMDIDAAAGGSGGGGQKGRGSGFPSPKRAFLCPPPPRDPLRDGGRGLGQLARGREMVSVPGVCLQHLSLCGFWGWREGGSRNERRGESRLIWLPLGNCSCLGARTQGFGGSERAQGAADQSQETHIFFFPHRGAYSGTPNRRIREGWSARVGLQAPFSKPLRVGGCPQLGREGK